MPSRWPQDKKYKEDTLVFKNREAEEEL